MPLLLTPVAASQEMRLDSAVAALASLAVSGGSLEGCLQHGLSAASTLVLPSSPDYINATTSQNLSWLYFASAVVFVGAPDDASLAVRCAAAHHVPVTPRGGRHSYASFGSGGQNGSVVVDVSALKSFSYDAATGHATLGAGFRLGNLALALDAHARGTPHGTCPYVGIGGHAACGGFGQASRQWGLAVDQVVRVQAVTAAGDVLSVSETEHPDLFWVSAPVTSAPC